MVDPQHKITIGGIDVSEYIVSDNFINITTTNPIDNGVLFLDVNAPITVKAFAEVKFFLKFDGSFVHIFTGLVKRFKLNDSKDRNRLEIVNNSYRYLKKTATNKFREDTGNGNAITIVQNLNDEYTPEITHNATSTPSTTFSFIEQGYQNKFINEIYDYIARLLDRQWWVDKDKVLNFKTRTFTLVDEELTEVNVNGALIIDTDTSKMANNVIVDGAKLTTNITQTATGDGTTTFSLDIIPSGTMKINLGGTNEQSIALEGVENFNVDFDCYIQVEERKAVFTVAPHNTQAINFTYDVFSMVHTEVQDGASIEDNQITIDKVFTEDNITKQGDADIFAQNYLDLYSQPLQLISANVRLSSQSQITNWQVGNKIPINYTGANTNVNGDFNIVGITYRFGERGIFLEISFTDFPESGQDMLKNLILKVKQREERERKSNRSTVKFFFWGANVYIELENISVEQVENLDGQTLILNHPTQGQLDTNKLGPVPGASAGTTTRILTLNSDRGFKDRFEKDRWFEETGSTDAVWISGSTSYVFNNGSTYFSKFIEKNNKTFTKVRKTIDADDDDNFQIDVISTESGVFETVGTTPTTITSGSSFKYRATYNGAVSGAEFRGVELDFNT